MSIPVDWAKYEAQLIAQQVKEQEIKRRNTTFECLSLKPNLLKGVYEMGFHSPSQIQETALSILLANPPKNLIAQSQSGTGKTAAFILAALSRVDVSKKYPQVLCISPTYELALQTGEVAAIMSMYMPDLEMIYAVSRETFARGEQLTQHVIFGTPGKVLDLCLKYRLFDIKLITVFVLDEADIMIATQGHQDQCIRVHKHLDQEHCQMMLFSATYDQQVMDFAEVIVPNPIIIRLKREDECLDNIKQYYVKCRNPQEKFNAITNIYGSIGIGQAIIFCNSRRMAHWLAGEMIADGHAVAVLTGQLTVEERLYVLDNFRAGLVKVLVSTNVLSRGIDVEQVTVVVNFDLPLTVDLTADYDSYLHRIGRTGRFGKAGIAINLVESQCTMDLCRLYENHFKKPITFLNTDDGDEIEKIGF